ncbi:hypothetical protein FD754_008326, partial [Muntiacus muntjak]
FFLFELKVSHKAAETICNINNALGPGTAKERTAQWCFRKFCKGDESLEDEERTGQPSEVIQHLKQTRKVKKLGKKNRFEVLSSLILHNGEPFLKWIVTCNEKWILYDTQQRPAQWLD